MGLNKGADASYLGRASLASPRPVLSRLDFVALLRRRSGEVLLLAIVRCLELKELDGTRKVRVTPSNLQSLCLL